MPLNLGAAHPAYFEEVGPIMHLCGNWMLARGYVHRQSDQTVRVWRCERCRIEVTLPYLRAIPERPSAPPDSQAQFQKALSAKIDAVLTGRDV